MSQVRSLGYHPRMPNEVSIFSQHGGDDTHPKPGSGMKAYARKSFQNPARAHEEVSDLLKRNTPSWREAKTSSCTFLKRIMPDPDDGRGHDSTCQIVPPRVRGTCLMRMYSWQLVGARVFLYLGGVPSCIAYLGGLSAKTHPRASTAVL